MQKIKKLVSVLAAGVMLTSIAGLSANATDETTAVTMESVLEELNAGTLTIEQAEEMLSVGQVRSAPFYYVPYDTYLKNALSTSPHYLAVVPKQGTTFESSLNISFYLNANIVESTPTASNLILGKRYVGHASVKSVTPGKNSNGYREFIANVSFPEKCSIDYALFTYELPFSNAIASEYDFDRYTSWRGIPSSDIYTGDDSITFKKCVYSMGDVDRDGDVDKDDQQKIGDFVVGLGRNDPNRTTEESYYDAMAFRLAADIDGSGMVELADAVAVTKYFNNGK